MLKVEKVATPATAVTVVAPASVPPPGSTPSATVTLPVNPVATFPLASSAVTATAGLSVRPAAAVLGCVVKMTWLAAPAVILNGVLVAGVSVPEVATSV